MENVLLTLIYWQFGRFVELIFYRLIPHFINYLANVKVNKEIIMKDPNFLSAPCLQISSLL